MPTSGGSGPPSDLSRKSREMIEVDEKPVTRSETCTSGVIATMPDELFQEFKRAVDAYARDDESSGP